MRNMRFPLTAAMLASAAAIAAAAAVVANRSDPRPQPPAGKWAPVDRRGRSG